MSAMSVSTTHGLSISRPLSRRASTCKHEDEAADEPLTDRDCLLALDVVIIELLCRAAPMYGSLPISVRIDCDPTRELPDSSLQEYLGSLRRDVEIGSQQFEKLLRVRLRAARKIRR